MQSYIPVIMGEKVVGSFGVDLGTGEFSGRFDQEFADILQYGLDEHGVRAVYLASIFGMAARQDMTAQDRLRSYLRDETEKYTDD